MLKIVAGKYKGRNLFLPDNNITRPTLSKVREAVFSSLGSRISQGVFLDLFAGSGAMGFEALSRGARITYFCDNSSNSVKCITRSADKIGLKSNKDYYIYNCDYNVALRRLSNISSKIDVVYLDPPYEMTINEDIISFLIENDMMSSKGVIFSECIYETKDFDGYTKNIYKYGEKIVCKYTRID